MPASSSSTQATSRVSLPLPEASWLWSALVEDSPQPMYVVSRSGLVEYANAPAQELLRPASGGAVIGRPLADLLGMEAARERVELIESTLAAGQPVITEEVRKGRQFRSLMRPLPNTQGVMVVGMVGTSISAATAARVVRLRPTETGKLGTLTQREMEILKLIGVGMSTLEIAKHLGRSVKTIEWHRVSLGEKLGVANRVELARIAIGAGLVDVHENGTTTNGSPK